jgi:homogentisate 1,2-dioxygenase
MTLKYQCGFGNHFSSEALAGALPGEQNSPQKVRYGLYPEQLTGSAFTAPRAANLKTWVYRIRPSVQHGRLNQKVESPDFLSDFSRLEASPEQLRWDPVAKPAGSVDWLDSLKTLAGNGSVESQTGCAVHVYAATASMKDRFFYNADGEMLIVPQEGAVLLKTELGLLEVKPGEIACVPRGMRFQVELVGAFARGYVCENFGAPFRLPELGPIGANGLANPRHFLAPVAAYEERTGNFKMLAKFQGRLWQGELGHSPLDVVAWHGNWAPYKYDLSLFNTINTVSFDHPDPSIFTVLTSGTDTPGTANIDFVIFPPRWMVAEKTFRPPYFHRNAMSEFMGLIQGAYDAKADGFAPGGASLHNCMSGHGPDAETFAKATETSLAPHKIDGTMAFMFESRYAFRTTDWAMKTGMRQLDYVDCWKDLKPAPLR